jgi:predicted metal-dependent peptidase
MTAPSTTPSTAALERLTAAKLWLVSEPPVLAPPARDVPTAAAGASRRAEPRSMSYLAHALFALVPVASAEVPRMSVDEWWRLYVNQDWVLGAEVPEVGAELAHLTWHLLQDHADRARDMRVEAGTAECWHQAADATVCATLDSDSLRPDQLKDARELGLPPDRSAEEYFAALSRLPVSDGSEPGELPPDRGCGSGCDGLPRGHELPPDADAGGLDGEAGRDIRRRVAIAYRDHVTSRGTTPGDAWRWATELLEPRIAWEPLLAGAVRRAVGWAAGRTDYTYSRPSRRTGTAVGVVLPGMRRPLPRAAMVVDTSGSVDDRLLGRAMGEVDGALRSLGLGGEGVTVLSCDAAVQTVGRVRRAGDARLAGGGGTDMRVGLQEAEQLRPRPDLVVVFTDGYTPWPATPPPGAAVVVALLGRERAQLPPTPDWAVRVECLLD